MKRIIAFALLLIAIASFAYAVGDFSPMGSSPLPEQTGNSGKVLTTNGRSPSWSAVGSVTAPGSNTYVPFNDGGVFGTDSTFNYNKSSDTLEAGTFHTTSGGIVFPDHTTLTTAGAAGSTVTLPNGAIWYPGPNANNLLWDEFSTVRKAGDMDATNSDYPDITYGGVLSKRTVTDTEYKLSIPYADTGAILYCEYGTRCSNPAPSITFSSTTRLSSFADSYSWIEYSGADFSPWATAAGDAVYMVRLYDSSGREAWGYLGAKGSGAALGSELITDPNFDDNASWIKQAGWDVAGGLATSSTTTIKYIYQNYNYGALKLYKGALTGNSYTSGTYRIYLLDTATDSYSDGGDKIRYYVPTTSEIKSSGIMGLSSLVADFAGFSVKQVTSPSASGVWVYRDKARATNGWNIDGSFNMNDTTYTWSVYAIGNASGTLKFTGGKASAAWGDPGIWYPSTVRTPGRMLKMRFQITDATQSTEFGFDSNTAGNIVGSGIRNASDTWVPYDGSTANGAVFVPADNKVYDKLIALRAGGAFYFAKGGTLTYWSMLWRNSTDTTATLYPGISNYNAASVRDSLRIPSTLWLPTPLASDGFKSANTTKLNTLSTDGKGHAEGVAGGIGSGGNGIAWSGNDTWTVSGNALINTPTLGAELATGNCIVGTWYKITASETDHFYTGSVVDDIFRATATTALDANNKVKPLTLQHLLATVNTSTTPNVLVSADLTLTDNMTQSGVALNVDSTTAPANFVVGYTDKIYCKLSKNVAGTWSSLVNTACTYSSGATIRVIKDSTSYGLYYNNALIGAIQTVSDAGIISGTRHGLFSTIATNTMDNFTVYDRGSSTNAYSILDNL